MYYAIATQMTFVELAHLSTDRDKQQEALMLQSELFSLAEAIKRLKELDGYDHLLRQSRLTKILGRALVRSSSFMLVGCLELNQEGTYESLGTLNFLRR